MKFGIYTLIIENHIKKVYEKNGELLFTFLTYGWGMGYVLLPYDHPFYGKDYDSIDVNIHGGLTFAKKFSEDSDRNFLDWVRDREVIGDVTRENFENFKNYWIIGFDTNHYGDDLNICSKEYVISETNSLLEQCLDDNVKGMKNYKAKFLRKDKLNQIMPQ